jgi:redox-sensitive bicupin YhaK (pirin superfamily)
MKIRLSNTRGYLKNDMIESRRTFSNNSYWNPRYMNWNNLIKVINDDILQPGRLIPKHEHKNIDVLGYLVEGQLEHWDSEGNLNIAGPGQIQRMWCGKSIWHTEKCVSETPARYLQIWILPNEQDTEPFYELHNKGIEFGPLGFPMKQNIKISGGVITGEKSLNITSPSYLYMVSGTVTGDGFTLNEGDGAELDPGVLSGNFNGHIILFES